MEGRTDERCLRCGSGNLWRRRTYEHPRCGCIVPEQAVQSEDWLDCPQCGRVGASEFETIGALYECRDCDERFDTGAVSADRIERPRSTDGSGFSAGIANPAGVQGANPSRSRLVTAILVGILLVAGIEGVVAVAPLFAGGSNEGEPTWRSYDSIVAFRNDDIQARWRAEEMRQVDRIFVEEDVPVTLGVIPAIGGEPVPGDDDLCAYLTDRVRNHPELFEVALHGYTHENRTGFAEQSEFGGLPYDEQRELVSRGTTVLTECTTRTPTTFVAPFNTYDDNTTRALRAENYTVVSGGGFFTEWYYNRTESFERDSLYHVPHSAGFVRNWSSLEFYDDETLHAQFDRAHRNGSVFVQMLHYQDFTTPEKRAQLRGLIDHMQSKDGVKFVTVGELAAGLGDGTIRRTGDGWQVRERVEPDRSRWREHSEAVRTFAVRAWDDVTDAFQPIRLQPDARVRRSPGVLGAGA